MLKRLRTGLERILEVIAILLLAALSGVVIVGIGFRTAGYSLVWYDEVASILLAWLTYYGAALAALKRAHIGFPGLVKSLSPARQRAVLLLAETLVIGFMILLAWTGWQVVEVVEGDRLVSLPWVPLPLALSAIPVGAVLFILAETLSLPALWRECAVPPKPQVAAAQLDTSATE